MENVADALKTAAAVMFFVIALSVAMTMITKARVTSKAVIDMKDIQSNYEYLEVSDEKRIVGMETIIPTLYKYYKEDYAIVFRNQNGNPLPLYISTVNSKYWNQAYLDNIVKNNNKDIYGNRLDSTNYMIVCSFDLESEIARAEPWTHGASQNKTIENFLNMFISGGTFILPSNPSKFIDFNSNVYGVFSTRFKNVTFEESIGRIQEKESTSEIVSSLDSKKIIYYTLTK